MEMIVLAAGRGTRLWALTGGRPKHLLKVGGMTLLDRHLAFAESAGLAPVIVTRAEHADDFRGHGAEVIVEESPSEMMTTLHFVRSHVREPFVWVGGDMLFTDFAPLRQLIAAYRDGGSEVASSTPARSASRQAQPRPEPQVRVTRQGEFPFSLPNSRSSRCGCSNYLPATSAIRPATTCHALDRASRPVPGVRRAPFRDRHRGGHRRGEPLLRSRPRIVVSLGALDIVTAVSVNASSPRPRGGAATISSPSSATP